MMNSLSLTRKDKYFYLARTIGIVLLIAMGGLFLFSGYSKIYSQSSFDNFQWTFLDLGISSVTLAGIIARVMIGLEFALGLLLIFHIYLKEFTYKAVIALLSIFIVYLIFVIIKQGNTGNCGCFGDKLAMKPLAAIYKNILMIAATVLLMYIYPIKPYKNQEWVGMALTMACLVIPFIVQPLDMGTSPEPQHSKVNLGLLYNYTPAPDIDLRHGKHIVAFMSLTCPHCKKAAYLMGIIHKSHPTLPLYMVLDGAEAHEDAFWDETHAQDVPHLIYRHSEDFLQLAGSSVPSVYWMEGDSIEYKSVNAYYQLDPKVMEDWMAGKAFK